MQPSIPTDLTDDELANDWMLSELDLAEVRRCRGDANRHSFAIQLCVLRRYGRFLGNDYGSVPIQILNHIGRQLGMAPMLFATPPSRKETDATHERRLREYLGFSTFDDPARGDLERWVRDHAASGMLVDELVIRAEEYLFERKVIAPARSTVERLVRSVASRSEEDKMASIYQRLPAALCTAIDELIVVPEDAARSRLEELRESAPVPTADEMIIFLQRAKYLRELELERVDLGELPGVTPAVIAHFAELVRRYDVTRIRRFGLPMSHAMVACFLLEREKSLLDDIVQMHHVYLLGLDRRARNAFRDRRLNARHDLQANVSTLIALAQAVRKGQPECTLEVFRQEHVDDETLRLAITGCIAFERIEVRGLLDAQLARHSNLKKYLPRFLSLPFEGGEGTAPLKAALTCARVFHEDGRTLGHDTPVDFAKGVWRKSLDVTSTSKGPDSRVWELALAFEVDAALRRGDLYLPRSREHVPFWNLVHSPERWAEQRDRSYLEMKLPPEPNEAVARLRREFDDAADAFVNGLPDNRFAEIATGELKLHRRDALEISKEVRELRSAIEAHMPAIGIEDLLVDVDRRCHFIRELRPLGTQISNIENLYPTLLATLLAHGTNLGLAQMAQASRIPIESLQYVSRWFFRDETLRAANRVLVDYHHHLPLAEVWGYGGFSSSDGQRWAVQQGSLHAALYPRHFGFYDRAINVITHVSDQHSVFASRAISCGIREALYVLDGLLENDTVLEPVEHTTDTHGSTEQLFGLCYLLGISFMPRFADLADVQLYRLDRARSYGALDGLLRSIDVDILCEQWDALVRITASLRDRSAPAHLVLDRLVANISDRPAKALTMLGRIVKTTHVLNYLHDPKLRDRIQLQLNRGEARHGLAKKLRFANQGAFRSGDLDEIMNKVSALSVLSNAVLVWNTERISSIVQELDAATGQSVAREDLGRVSPFQHARLLVSGRYNFDRAMAS